jgi:hypothetical protein
MRRVTGWRGWGRRAPIVMALALAALAVAPPAHARPRSKIEWVRVDVPGGDDAARVQKLLKQALGQAAKKANFGKARTVTLSARVVEMTTEERGDVLRITCTVMGRVVGGAGARSRISYGGSPDKREELEKEVLTQVANGLVARLAQIVRTKERKVD